MMKKPLSVTRKKLPIRTNSVYKFMEIDPERGTILVGGICLGEAIAKATDESKKPRWYEKALGFTYPHWQDHACGVVGCDVVCAQPYTFSPEDLTKMLAFCAKWDVEWMISGVSAHFPGRTVGIFLSPSVETYNKLGLKVPANHWMHPRCHNEDCEKVASYCDGDGHHYCSVLCGDANYLPQ